MFFEFSLLNRNFDNKKKQIISKLQVTQTKEEVKAISLRPNYGHFRVLASIALIPLLPKLLPFASLPVPAHITRRYSLCIFSSHVIRIYLSMYIFIPIFIDFQNYSVPTLELLTFNHVCLFA